MKRGVVLIALMLVLGACGGSKTKGPATYAQLHPTHAPAAVEVWRDAKGRLTFHWLGDHRGEVERYDPSTLALAEFSDGQALGSTRYLSSHAAWAAIHAMYGVTRATVTSALAEGTPSAEPAAYSVKAPLATAGLYEASTDYGMDIARMAKETGLTLPRLTSLGGYPLMGASMGPHGLGGIFFGSNPNGDSQINLNIAVERPGHPDAPGTVYKQFFGKARHHGRSAGIRYAVIDFGVIFPYHGEWISVSGDRVKLAKRAAIVHAILAAPTT